MRTHNKRKFHTDCGSDIAETMSKHAKISDHGLEPKLENYAIVSNSLMSSFTMPSIPISVGDHKGGGSNGLSRSNQLIGSEISSSLVTPVRTCSLPHLITPQVSMSNLRDESESAKFEQKNLCSNTVKSSTPFEVKSTPSQSTVLPTPETKSIQLLPAQETKGIRVVKRSNIYRGISYTKVLLGCILLSVALFVTNNPFSTRTHAGINTVYVPGAGFSGFWFTLGRLQSIPRPTSKDYYCFSAGCLGVVATVSNFTIEEVLNMAIGVQTQWRTGEISQYQVVNKFLDVLLQRFKDHDVTRNSTTLSSMDSSDLLSRLHIITSVQRNYVGLYHVVRTPTNVDELREYLLQTTWIPIALGADLTHKGHLDGAFTAHQHPLCEQSLDLPLIPDLYLNALNVNLSKEKVEKLWNAGLQYSS